MIEMKLSIRIDKPDWDPHPEKTTTDNWVWRKCVIVEFPNCPFKWIPTYQQLEDIKKALEETEKINKELAKGSLNCIKSNSSFNPQRGTI